MASDRYARDPGIADIILYFDQPEHAAWHLLTDKEARVLYEEIRKCSDPDTGFPYTARNYYWITTKDGSDILLRFKETQEMMWEIIRYLRLRGRGVKLMVIKARQLYISSFCQGYLAWLTQFNPNNRGLLVSYAEDHAAKLFGMVLHIYDQLPWWLRPMIGARKYEEGIHLINPDTELRYLEPGLNSRITVQSAKQNVGVAEGETINSAMLSEYGSWDPAKARKIIMGDFRWALPDSPNTTAILETRVQNNSQFAERLWEAMVDLGEDADWYPFFIPIYFDRSHFVAPKPGWRPDKPEIAVKTRAAEEWCACTNCGQIRPARFGGASMEGIPCRDCQAGFYSPYLLQDGQMRWLELTRMNAEKMGDSAVTEMQQSLATNPQEAFARVTETIFSRQARDWVSSTTKSDCLARGYMRSDGVFHGPRRVQSAQPEVWGEESAQCFTPGCKDDHRGDPERYLKIWQPPMRGTKYAIGVDVASGQGGGHDYSVIWVNRIGQLPQPDIQVAMYRCNTISAWHLADLANSIGKWYNNALLVVDYTNYQTTGDRLLNYYHYPNLYRWLIPDSINRNAPRWHWVWTGKNKESAWQVLDGWLRDHAFIAKDPTFAKELRHFQRLPDGSMGAPSGKSDDGLGEDFEKIHDDTVMACISVVVASHQQDPRRPAEIGTSQAEGLRGPGEWAGACTKCGKTFEAHAPQERSNCPHCGSIWLKWSMGKEEKPPLGFVWHDMSGISGSVRDKMGASHEISFGYGGMTDGQDV